MKLKIIHEFEPDDLQDKEQNRILHASDAYFVLNWMQEHLRSEYKYNDALSEETTNFIERLRDDFSETLAKYGVDLYSDLP